MIDRHGESYAGSGDVIQLNGRVGKTVLGRAQRAFEIGGRFRDGLAGIQLPEPKSANASWPGLYAVEVAFLLALETFGDSEADGGDAVPALQGLNA